MADPDTSKHNGAPDTEAQQIGSTYAKALLAAAEKSGQTDALMEEFDSLVADVLDGNPQFEALLVTHMLTEEEAEGVLERVLGGKASPLLLNFLKVLARRDRLDCVRAVHASARELFQQMRGRRTVMLRTATPLDPGLAGKIADGLRQRMGIEPVLEQTVDPDLVGGLVLRIGDTVYDGSVRTQLERARTQMIDRSTHEIQSRRDRFGYSG